MSFNVSADAYGRFMGRYSEPLAAEFVEIVDAQAGQRAIDVGCGPGALTRELVARLGSEAVAAVDPSEPFVRAARASLPGSTSGAPRLSRCRFRATRSTSRWRSWSCTSWPTWWPDSPRWRG